MSVTDKTKYILELKSIIERMKSFNMYENEPEIELWIEEIENLISKLKDE